MSYLEHVALGERILAVDSYFPSCRPMIGQTCSRGSRFAIRSVSNIIIIMSPLPCPSSLTPAARPYRCDNDATTEWAGKASAIVIGCDGAPEDMT